MNGGTGSLAFVASDTIAEEVVRSLAHQYDMCARGGDCLCIIVSNVGVTDVASFGFDETDVAADPRGDYRVVLEDAITELDQAVVGIRSACCVCVCVCSVSV